MTHRVQISYTVSCIYAPSSVERCGLYWRKPWYVATTWEKSTLPDLLTRVFPVVYTEYQTQDLVLESHCSSFCAKRTAGKTRSLVGQCCKPGTFSNTMSCHQRTIRSGLVGTWLLRWFGHCMEGHSNQDGKHGQTLPRGVIFTKSMLFIPQQNVWDNQNADQSEFRGQYD